MGMVDAFDAQDLGTEEFQWTTKPKYAEKQVNIETYLQNVAHSHR